MGQRIKGQEFELIMLINSVPRENLVFNRSVELTFQTEIKQEGYLAETTDRYDTIYNGIKGNMDYHYDSPEPFIVAQAIVDKAQRRTPGTKFNLKATLSFPSGRRVRVIVPDIEFGPMPFAFGSRSDFGSFKLDYAASDARALIL